MSKSILRIDWATYESAKYACENWHYSKCTPKSKQLWIGVWEDDAFVGIVAIGRSSGPSLQQTYKIKVTEIAEITRIALKNHKTPVSRIVAIAVRILKKQSPGVRLLVSYADANQGHHGGIYQAGNWIYVGQSTAATQYYFRNKWRNDANLSRHLVKHPEDRQKLPKRKIQAKHKYLMPLDEEMRQIVLPLKKEFPKRPKQAMTGDQPEQRWGSTNPDAPNVSGDFNG
jgi:hypothetical protein